MVTGKHPMIAQGRTAEIFAWGKDQVLKLLTDWCPAAMVEVHLVINTNFQDQGIVNSRLLGSLLGEGLRTSG